MSIVDEKLKRGDVVILDGAIGTEIQNRGVTMDIDAWCGRATLTHPEVILGLHTDYIAAGADVITTNTFSSNRFVLEPAGLVDQFEEVNRKAVALAQQARDSTGCDVAIAGSMSSMAPLAHMQQAPSSVSATEDYHRLANLLAEAGCDLLVCEMMMTPGHAEAVVKAARDTGLPVWIGISAHEDNGQVLTMPAPKVKSGRSIDDRQLLMRRRRNTQELSGFARSLLTDGAAAAGIMHSAVEDTVPGLETLKTVWSGPLLAYAHSGHFAPPDWRFVDVIAAEAYAETAASWVADHGVQIVGGCCGLGPDHIRAIKERLN